MATPCISAHRPGDQHLAGSPSFEPNAEYDERLAAIDAARDALDDAEKALDMKRFALCDLAMADAITFLVPA